jgi:hypothetical protein
MEEIIIQLTDCVENPLLGIKAGTSFVRTYGNDKDSVVQQVYEIVNANSESKSVGEVRFVCKLPDGEALSEEWTEYLQMKNSKLFENNLQG